MKYVYVCAICKKPQTFPIQPLAAPTCQGPENTHHKVMEFVPEMSEGTPDYLKKEKKK
jgi:hypothetical protein